MISDREFPVIRIGMTKLILIEQIISRVNIK